jgi:drug/metabolite transporter (DMT)-like permease
MGYIFVLLSLCSYGVLGICHKLAERQHCRPQLLAAMVMLSAFAGMNVLIITSSGATYSIPAPALCVALVCGSLALCALWAFQEGLKKGKISTSWLIINLSSAIPTIGSIVIYHEPVNLKKIAILALIFIAIVLIWKDGLEDLKKLDQDMRSLSDLSSKMRSGDLPFEREM